MQTCPRRQEGPQYDKVNEDTWEDGHGLIGQENYLSCSYCGSLNPETFMQWVAAGCEIGPTDKSYKTYIKGPQGTDAKFYFQHLNLVQMQKFVELYNDHTMQIGYPGNFYRLPYFMRKGSNDSTSSEA